MAIFCTKCGTQNDTGAAFCDNCGNALRPPLPAAPTPQGLPDVVPTAGAGGALPARGLPGRPKTMIYAGLALATVLVAGGAAMYFVLQAPSPTPANLLAAAKAGYDKNALDQERKELCLSNTDYRTQPLNVGEQDQVFRSFMDALVVAGLYSEPVQVTSGGFFQQTLLQYVATPELAKYREGSRLCLAKGVEIVEVTDIQKVHTESGELKGRNVKVTSVRGQMTLQALDVAPWLGKPGVSDVLMGRLTNWSYKNKKLEQQHLENFVLVDKRWTAGPDTLAKLENSAANGQYDEKRAQGKSSKSGENAEPGAGIGSKLAGMFSFGGHPLKGTWRSMATKQMGVELPAGLAPDIIFTADAMESGGGSTKCDFEVDGSRVTVTPKGQSQSLIFVMEGKDIMMAKAVGLRYERVK